MSLLSFISRFGLAGTLVPMLLGAVWWLINHASTHDLSLEIVMDKITLILWPPSLPLVAGAGWENAATGAKLFLIATVLNAVLYAGVGASVWFGIKKHHTFLLVPVLAIGALWGWLLSLR